MPISTMDGLPYLKGTQQNKESGSCHSCAIISTACNECHHAYNLSILDPTNENLMSAQKALLLDHFRLGHISIEHLRTLYQCPTDQRMLM